VPDVLTPEGGIDYNSGIGSGWWEVAVAWLGWLLILLGIAFIVLSLVGAARDLFNRAVAPAAAGLAELTEFGKMLTELLKVLFSGPAWVAMFMAGLALVLLGAGLV
jgi:hypothetical protein